MSEAAQAQEQVPMKGAAPQESGEAVWSPPWVSYRVEYRLNSGSNWILAKARCRDMWEASNEVTKLLHKFSLHTDITVRFSSVA